MVHHLCNPIFQDGQITPDGEAVVVLQHALLNSQRIFPTTKSPSTILEQNSSCCRHRLRAFVRLAIVPQKTKRELHLDARLLHPSFERQLGERVANVRVRVEIDAPVIATDTERLRAYMVEGACAVVLRVVCHLEIVCTGGGLRQAHRPPLSPERDDVSHGKVGGRQGKGVSGSHGAVRRMGWKGALTVQGREWPWHGHHGRQAWHVPSRAGTGASGGKGPRGGTAVAVGDGGPRPMERGRRVRGGSAPPEHRGQRGRAAPGGVRTRSRVTMRRGQMGTGMGGSGGGRHGR